MSAKRALRWDCWFLEHGDELRAFQLECDGDVDPELRHHHGVRIIELRGEPSLRRWERLGVALEPGAPGSWDDLALWTGCCVVGGGLAHLFYTGRCRERFWYQQVGLATSPLDDLGRWRREPAPVAVPSGRYRRPETTNELGTAPAWRDPWVYPAPGGGGWEMILSARDADRSSPYDGCIARLSSPDLRRWRPRDPLFSPGLFDELEVPQLLFSGGLRYLFFSTHATGTAPRWRRRFGEPVEGLHCWVAAGEEGEWRPANGDGIVPGLAGSGTYGVRLLAARAPGLHPAIGFRDRGADGRFAGGLSPARMIRLDGESVRCERAAA